MCIALRVPQDATRWAIAFILPLLLSVSVIRTVECHCQIGDAAIDGGIDDKAQEKAAKKQAKAAEKAAKEAAKAARVSIQTLRIPVGQEYGHITSHYAARAMPSWGSVYCST